jgi:hypothetical protein
MFAESLFYISFSCITVMLGIKLIEKHRGEISWWASLIDRADARIHRFLRMLEGKYRLWKKISGIFIFEFLPAYLFEQVVKLKDYLYKKYHTSAGSLKGEKRMLRNTGSVSEFLQSISKEGEKTEKSLE